MFDFIKKINQEEFLFRFLPRIFLELMRKYLRLKIEGLENLPRRGPAIIAPNHSGYSGFDGMFLNYIIQKERKRIPRVMIHRVWFFNNTLTIPAHKLGFYEATYANCIKELNKKNLIVLFPEGESGNFKPTNKMYQLQEFKRGFIRMAIETGAPIIPTIIIGAEETHINLSQLKLFKKLTIPLPLNIIPLPAKWRIHFLDPITLPYNKDSLKDDELIHDLAQEVQEKMQDLIRKEIQRRGHAFW